VITMTDRCVHDRDLLDHDAATPYTRFLTASPWRCRMVRVRGSAFVRPMCSWYLMRCRQSLLSIGEQAMEPSQRCIGTAIRVS
jgi:hypothetical protein